jgi:hypothetical protein
VGKRRLYVGAWQHGISLHGWRQGRPFVGERARRRTPVLPLEITA